MNNAEKIRDLVMDRMRGLRNAGLGDPDEVDRPSAPPDQDAAARMLTAARELLGETRRPRGSLTA